MQKDEVGDQEFCSPAAAAAAALAPLDEAAAAADPTQIPMQQEGENT